MTRSSLSFVLHGHLPFIRHPEHDFHLEERWFYEAMHECYLPLLQMLRNLDADGVPGKLTFSLSATLIAMMADPMLIERFCQVQDELLELARRERERLKDQPEYDELTHYYLHRFESQKELFESFDRDILKAFAGLHHSGRIELITCVGTHGVLPLMATDEAMSAQVTASVEDFKRRLGFQPSGIWLAECGYTPGVERYLRNNNISYTFIEGDAILNAESPAVAGTYAPLISDLDVAFFGRSKTASAEVWSAKEGYPGDFNYREFYRDLGYDLPLELIEEWIHPDGIRVNTGFKYHRITGNVDLGEKELYSPSRARETAQGHAKDFVYKRIQEAKRVGEFAHLNNVHFTCPYDAELFGHWWFEGPLFLEEVFREAAYHDSMTLESPVEYLIDNPIQQQANPSPSTWGENGSFEFWVDPCNVWIYPLLHDAELRFRDLVNSSIVDPSPIVSRALDQAGRELLLAQASDWAFIMKTGTTVEYAELRTRQHLKRFHALADQIESLDIHEDELQEFEDYTPIFPNLSWQYWKTQ